MHCDHKKTDSGSDSKKANEYQHKLEKNFPFPFSTAGYYVCHSLMKLSDSGRTRVLEQWQLRVLIILYTAINLKILVLVSECDLRQEDCTA